MAVGENWYSRAKTEAEKDLSRSDRVVGITIMVFCTLMLSYFIAHNARSTGFFTSEFRIPEIILLYGSLVFWIISSSLDAIFNRRLLSRLLDTFGGVIFVCFGFAWLFIVLPFEMVYFADVLPESLRFLVQWISDDIARVLLGLGFIVHLVAAIYCPIAYGFVIKKRSKDKKLSDSSL